MRYYEMDKDINHNNRVITIDNVEYRLTRLVDKTATNIHHIISRKLHQKYNVRHPKNLVRINMREHDALNRFFLDKQNPREQLIKVFEIVKPVLSKWVKDELCTILYECDDDLFYDQDLLKWKKQKKKGKEKSQNK